jgi:replicative DNA helicase
MTQELIKPIAPPWSLDAEQAVLASMIIGGEDTITRAIAEKVDDTWFYRQAHAILFRAIRELHHDGTPVDEISIMDWMVAKDKWEKIGGNEFLVELVNRIETSAHMLHWIQILREKAIRRDMIRSFTIAVEAAYDEGTEVESIIAQSKNEIDRFGETLLTATHKGDALMSMDQALASGVSMINEIVETRGEASRGISTGLSDVDRITGGLKNGEYIILAGRPGTGKTSLALQIAAQASSVSKKKGLFFSLEMSTNLLIKRMLCSRAGIDMSKLDDMGSLGPGGDAKMVKAISEIKSSHLWIDQTSAINIGALKNTAYQLTKTKGIDFIVIDYIQLIRAHNTKASREQQLTEISGEIMSLKKELRIPVIVLAQINRDSVKENRPPRASDLRESGSLEQDADQIWMLYNDIAPKGQEPRDNVVHCGVVKNRNGRIGSCELYFNKMESTFLGLST